MSYAGFCEECGVPYYESDRLAHQHLQPQAESAPNEHAINVEVAKIARDEGWSLPDADLIEFGVKVWNKAILSQHPIRPGRTKLLMKFWSAMHMAGFAKDKEWDAQEKIHIKDLVRLLERTEIMQQESKVQGEGEELHVNEMWEISRLKAKVAELQRELSQTRLPKCSQCGSDQLSAFACSSGKKGVSARVVVSCDSCGNEAEFATFFNRVLAGAASHNGQGWVSQLKQLRDDGWMVAVHNDYRQEGKHRTFWLFTRVGREGQFVKGEGETDADALQQITRQLASHTLPAPPSEYRVPKIDGQGATEEK